MGFSRTPPTCGEPIAPRNFRTYGARGAQMRASILIMKTSRLFWTSLVICGLCLSLSGCGDQQPAQAETGADDSGGRSTSGAYSAGSSEAEKGEGGSTASRNIEKDRRGSEASEMTAEEIDRQRNP